MHKDHPGYEADTLAVACVVVGYSVGMEDSSQSSLTTLLEGAGKVRMRGKCPSWEKFKSSH